VVGGDGLWSRAVGGVGWCVEGRRGGAVVGGLVVGVRVCAGAGM
jgi:hypothetical protein